MAPWESGTLSQEGGTLVAQVRFRPPRIARQVVHVTTGTGSERVPGLKRGEGEYEVIGEHQAPLVDQAHLMLRRLDGQVMKVHIRAGFFDVKTGWFDAMSEWTAAGAGEEPL
jgi:hypothetical protein